MKSKFCKGNTETTVISNFGTGMPKTFNITIETVNKDEIAGYYIEKRYFWIFPQKPIKGELKANMKFNRYWINGIYKVIFRPSSDIKITID